jgi:hypothetical protein
MDDGLTPSRFLGPARLLQRWRELRDGVGLDVPDPERAREIGLTPPRPYPGLRSFAPDDTGLFFARERQIDGLIERLSRANIMVVLGGSGCGKSSLVRAGLIPRLFAGDAVPGRPGRWYVLELRPGEDPNAALLAAIADQLVTPILRITDAADPLDGPTLGQRALAQAFGLEPAGNGEALRQTLLHKIAEGLFPGSGRRELRSRWLNVSALFTLAGETLDRLDAALSRGLRAGAPNLLILVDQFEEVFRPEVTREGRGNLRRLVEATFEARPPCLFLALTLRSEELHRCAEGGLAGIITDTAYLLGPIDDDVERRETIVSPARAVIQDWLGIPDGAQQGRDTAPFEPEVVELLLQEVRHLLDTLTHASDHLPLLQHGLLQIWDSAAERWRRVLAEDGMPDFRILRRDVEAAMRSDVATPGWLVRCLNQHADAVYATAAGEVARLLPDAGKPETREARAELLLRTIFCAMARKDDRGNWARRFVTARPARRASGRRRDGGDGRGAEDLPGRGLSKCRSEGRRADLRRLPRGADPQLGALCRMAARGRPDRRGARGGGGQRRDRPGPKRPARIPALGARLDDQGPELGDGNRREAGGGRGAGPVQGQPCESPWPRPSHQPTPGRLTSGRSRGTRFVALGRHDAAARGARGARRPHAQGHRRGGNALRPRLPLRTAPGVAAALCHEPAGRLHAVGHGRLDRGGDRVVCRYAYKLGARHREQGSAYERRSGRSPVPRSRSRSRGARIQGVRAASSPQADQHAGS